MWSFRLSCHVPAAAASCLRCCCLAGSVARFLLIFSLWVAAIALTHTATLLWGAIDVLSDPVPSAQSPLARARRWTPGMMPAQASPARPSGFVPSAELWLNQSARASPRSQSSSGSSTDSSVSHRDGMQAHLDNLPHLTPLLQLNDTNLHDNFAAAHDRFAAGQVAASVAHGLREARDGKPAFITLLPNRYEERGGVHVRNGFGTFVWSLGLTQSGWCRKGRRRVACGQEEAGLGMRDCIISPPSGTSTQTAPG